ncbi:KUP/HAK/KT family potassium transporter [Sphingobium sp. MI1205]|uniref:KUP/HAK/KT family potassium transporter n=1 Tax=Sphingobium sp. MI1205 TaxID=407020 RepID=UPI003FA6EEB9
MPSVNWGLLVMVLVLGFGESTRLASAYGISVIGTMLITTLMLGFLVFKVWCWNRWLVWSSWVAKYKYNTAVCEAISQTVRLPRSNAQPRPVSFSTYNEPCLCHCQGGGTSAN